MLKVEGLSAGYGNIVAVRECSFSVGGGEVLVILGANGAGKTSTLMALMGLVTRMAGTIIMAGQDISDAPVEKRVRMGLSLVPEGRRVFPDLSVRENLMIGGHSVSRPVLSRGIGRVFGYFPRLGDRADQPAGSLSGGEQQMLAMGRALVPEPTVLIVDELSLGLMPKVVDKCYQVLHRLRSDGLTIILVEQDTERALAAADRVCILEAGNLTWSGSAEEARNRSTLAEGVLGV
ncbi:MAG: ABC transporter ATP-binding protein [Paracoccaceae bacterium]